MILDCLVFCVYVCMAMPSWTAMMNAVGKFTMQGVHADGVDDVTLFVACLRGAWLPMQAAAKKPLIKCTFPPAGVAAADYERHVECAPAVSLHLHTYNCLLRLSCALTGTLFWPPGPSCVCWP